MNEWKINIFRTPNTWVVEGEMHDEEGNAATIVTSCGKIGINVGDEAWLHLGPLSINFLVLLLKVHTLIEEMENAGEHDNKIERKVWSLFWREGDYTTTILNLSKIGD